MPTRYDFGGYATRNNIKCADGRTILKDAFKDNDGQTVPLVWQHIHNDATNVLGHALLENREDGVYAYCSFNDTPYAQNTKALVEHGDISALSIYANKLKQKNGAVIHGAIREVSLVLAGANPGAYIDVLELSHSADSEIENDEAIITGIEGDIHLAHADADVEPKSEAPSKEENTKKENTDMAENSEKTVQDVIDSMTDEQKKVLYALVGMAAEGKGAKAESGSEGGAEVKHNAFEDYNGTDDEMVLSHDAMDAIMKDAKRCGSLKESVLEHSAEYGIDTIEYLFPDEKNLTNVPEFIKRPDDWVGTVMNAVHHTPFSRVKSMFADITADEARAKGYVKGNRKMEEVITLLRRSTTPTTIYKKQKLDRDDIVDITDFDVVAWLKTEMRLMLNEEIARAILISDGRSSADEDKISEEHVRPIWKEDDLFTINKLLTFTNADDEDARAKEFIKSAIKARKDYRGSGNPVLYTTEDWLTTMLLLEDTLGHPLYKTEAELATKLRVSKIVTVPAMENQKRTVNGVEHNLIGIIVNMADYNVGADKGGAINMFDDFDIDYNQQKYLIETRISGALTKPYSAIILEWKAGA